MKVYIGNINTYQHQKTEMPMLGGFLTIENFNVELRGRASSGNLMVRKVAQKKRLIFEFQHIRPVDFELWVSQQRLHEWREIEYEEDDGSFTKLIVNFTGEYSHLKKRTNHIWLYGQTSFILEEV